MATEVYNWKGKKYTDETLHEAPKAFLKLLKERGVEVPDAEKEEEDKDAG